MSRHIAKNLVKRAVPRNPTEAVITCRPYGSRRAVQTVDGIMRNYSSQGSYVEASGKFASGTILVVRMIRYPSLASRVDGDIQPRTIGLAEVKWCRSLEKGTGNRYGMGLRYLD